MKNSEDARKAVEDICREFDKSIQEHTVGFDKRSQWLIVCRAVNSIFSWIYKPTIKFVDQQEINIDNTEGGGDDTKTKT